MPHLSPEFLSKQAPEGWWPYLPGREPSTEATAWCAIACRNKLDSAAKSLEYLVSIQNKDGGWSTRAGTEPSDWTTGLAMLAAQVLQNSLAAKQEKYSELISRSKKTVSDSAIYLLRTRADFITEFTRIAMLILQGPDFDYPRGWAWTPNTFNWIEPTSHAILAIKMSPLSADKPYQLAIKEANEYYLEKACRSGGWNYGVPVSVGAQLPSQPVPTAWALLALHGVSNPTINKGIELLSTLDDVTTKTLQAQALSILALNAHDVDVKEKAATLHEQFNSHDAFSQNFMIAGMCSIASNLPKDGNPLIVKSRQ
jgi:hypothetical protein